MHLTTVEIAYGDRPHAVTERGNPDHVQLRTRHELWHKERALNIAVEHLSRTHPDWQYVCWVDADVHFARDDWAEETVEQLQHYDVVQPWSQAHDTGPDHHVIKTMPSFCYAHVNGLQDPAKDSRTLRDASESCYAQSPGSDENKRRWHHPGLAWAFTRHAWETLGGLYEYAIVGGGDSIIALALIGLVRVCGVKHCSAAMDATLYEYERRAAALRRNIGYVSGPILHRFHGSKTQRGYGDRRRMLLDVGFDPLLHLKRDSQGLLAFADRGDEGSIKLRDSLRAYFRSRNEDGTEV